MTLGLNAVQRSSVLTAIQKMVKPGLDGCRSEADRDMVRLYEETGADRLKVKVSDVEVGTFTLCFSKDAYGVTDVEAFEDFCLANGFADVKREIRLEFMGIAIRLLQEEEPGVIRETVSVSKDVGKHLKRVGGGFLRHRRDAGGGSRHCPQAARDRRDAHDGCKSDVVLPALNALPEGVAGILMGGVVGE